MKRRKFLKFLALIPALPIACQGDWPFKPKSKPPPVERYDPDDPNIMVDLKCANGKIIKMRYDKFLKSIREENKRNDRQHMETLEEYNLRMTRGV